MYISALTTWGVRHRELQIMHRAAGATRYPRDQLQPERYHTDQPTEMDLKHADVHLPDANLLRRAGSGRPARRTSRRANEVIHRPVLQRVTKVLTVVNSRLVLPRATKVPTEVSSRPVRHRAKTPPNRKATTGGW